MVAGELPGPGLVLLGELLLIGGSPRPVPPPVACGGSCGSSLGAASPDGVPVNTLPKSSTAAQKVVVGQVMPDSTLERPCTLSIFSLAQALAPPCGSVAVKTVPPRSVVRQRPALGQATPNRPSARRVGSLQAAAPPVGLVEVMTSPREKPSES